MFQTGWNHWNLPPKGCREEETKEKVNVIKKRKEEESNPKAGTYDNTSSYIIASNSEIMSKLANQCFIINIRYAF